MNKKLSVPYYRQMIFIALFFFVFGFVTWINGALIPYLRIACQLEEWQTYLVTFAFYIAYTLTALPAGILLQKTGTATGMQIGLALMAAGCAFFIPAAQSRAYMLFLAGLFFVGTGLTILQIAVNPYVTLLGPLDKAAQRISIVGACNKFAGMLAPLVFGAVLLHDTIDIGSNAQELDILAQRVVVPYLCLGGFLLLLQLVVRKVGLPKIPVFAVDKRAIAERLDTPAFRARATGGFLAIFCSVGAEVVAGDTIGNYGIYHGMDPGTAGMLTSTTLTAMMLGYLIGILMIPRWLTQERAFALSNILALLVLSAVLMAPGVASVCAVALLGFANALLWPAIWPKTLKGLHGRQLHLASAILIMGIAGGATLPLVYGGAAKLWNNQWAYGILIPCYLYNLWFWHAGRTPNAEQLPIGKEVYQKE